MDLTVKISNVKFKNPLILASGILDEQGETMLRVARAGAGGIVTKSIGVDERQGYENPTVVDIENGLINAVGLSNPGIENFGDEIKIAKKGNVPVVGSIFGKENEFPYLAKRMEDYGVDAVELNFSCPHVKGYGSEIGQNPDLVEEIIKNVKIKVNIPVFAKLTPNVTSVVETAKAAEKADAIVLINTVRAIAIDVYAKKPILWNRFGGYSGPGIKPIGLRAVYDVRSEMDIPIIGVGGIVNWKDAVEYILAGANAVQIGSGIYYRGLGIFKEILTGIKNYMKKENFSKIEDFSGLAVK